MLSVYNIGGVLLESTDTKDASNGQNDFLVSMGINHQTKGMYLG